MIYTLPTVEEYIRRRHVKFYDLLRFEVAEIVQFGLSVSITIVGVMLIFYFNNMVYLVILENLITLFKKIYLNKKMVHKNSLIYLRPPLDDIRYLGKKNLCSEVPDNEVAAKRQWPRVLSCFCALSPLIKRQHHRGCTPHQSDQSSPPGLVLLFMIIGRDVI